MSRYYGFVVTEDGRELIAKLAAGQTLSIAKVMVGSGTVPEGGKPSGMKDLSEPVAAGTSTTPVYDDACVRMIIEYRSDLNGGLEKGFWLREFGVFANDPDKGEVLIYYGTLGDYPQYVCAASSAGVDVRRFPVCIVIGEDLGVTVDYKCEAWITAEEVREYCMLTVQPEILAEVKKMIDAHDISPDAHADLFAELQNDMEEIRQLPEDGNTGQILTKTEEGAEWKDLERVPDFDNLLAWPGCTRVTPPKEGGTWTESIVTTEGNSLRAKRVTVQNGDGDYTETYSFYAEDGVTVRERYVVHTMKDGTAETWRETVTKEGDTNG